jgi:hypothetical protein
VIDMAMLLKELQQEDRERTVARTLARSVGADVEEIHEVAVEDGPAVRTCAHCGEHVAFRLDPLGSWAECPVCGHLA